MACRTEDGSYIAGVSTVSKAGRKSRASRADDGTEDDVAEEDDEQDIGEQDFTPAIEDL